MIPYKKPELVKIKRTTRGLCSVGSQVGATVCEEGGDFGTEICFDGLGALL